MGSQALDYVDEDGFKRRVLLPSLDVAPMEGIPLSLDADRLFADAPLAFRVRLVQEFWAVGLIEPKDFLASDAPPRIRAALLSAVKHDTVSVIAFAKEHSK